ncbi:MAG: DUF3108 domain-containing protein [Thermodesulfovibrionales bacterium]|nr:DUF3108 domain-containing protein [Thermodesulfovibrionales bacterium]
MSGQRKIFKLFILAIFIATVIHAVVIVVLSKTSLFNFFHYFNKVIVAHLSQDNIRQEDKKTEEEHNLAKELDIESETHEESDLEQIDAHHDISDIAFEDTYYAETVVEFPKIRLEVPKYHDNILKQALIDEKVIDRVVLKYKHESLDYDLYWIGMYVGSARLKADTKDKELVITSEVHSSKIISNFYKVQDYAKSVLINGKPHNFRIKQHEGKYRSDKETFFDYDEGTITFVDYLKNKQMEHTVKEGIHWDVISGFYYLRTMPVINTDKIYVNVFDSNKFVKVQIVIIGKEKIEMRNGDEIDTIKAKVILHSEGLFQKVGDIFIWLKDDEYRIPLKVETKVPVGRVTAELKKRDVIK